MVNPDNTGTATDASRPADLPADVSETFLRANHDVVQRIWRKLTLEAMEKQTSVISEDFSRNGLMLMAGRILLPAQSEPVNWGGKANPVYWVVKDNRAHFSCGFNMLSEQNKMLLANQVLLACANRSHKDDLKSAALAVSRNGHFYTGINTQELPSMDWEKECAESNVTRIVKQLNPADDAIARMYVLGGVTNGGGKMHMDDHLIGMCMRCVEIASAVLEPEGKVTIIPANDGKNSISLRKYDSTKQLKPREAWEVSFDKLKGPSIIRFSEEAQPKQNAAFQKLQAGEIKADELLKPYANTLNPAELVADALQGVVSIPFLKANPTPEAVNTFMIAQLARAMEARKGRPVAHMGIAVVEITEGNHKRFEYAMEMKGADNAAINPLLTAISRADLPIPHTPESEYVSKAYVIGFNADGSPYNMNAEAGDRLLKRAGRFHADGTEVLFIPLNDGHYPEGDVVHRTVRALNPTDFPGSKQHPVRDGMNGEHQCGRC